MGLLSLFRPEADGPAARSVERGGSADDATIEQLRTRARRRLIGSAILVVAAVIAFSVLFETKPRPEGQGISVEVPRREGGTAVASGTVRATPTSPRAAPASVPGTGAASAAAARSATASEVITESAAEAARDKPVPAAPAKPVADPAKVAPKPPAIASAAAEGQRVAALLEGKDAKASPAAPATVAAREPTVAKAASAAKEAAAAKEAPANTATSRYVVQVGAFADVDAARAVRLRVEKLGLKTFTQVVDTPGGRRIRVRVGPYASREEADKTLARIRSDGLAAAVLTL